MAWNEAEGAGKMGHRCDGDGLLGSVSYQETGGRGQLPTPPLHPPTLRVHQPLVAPHGHTHATTHACSYR